MVPEIVDCLWLHDEVVVFGISGSGDGNPSFILPDAMIDHPSELCVNAMQ